MEGFSATRTKSIAAATLLTSCHSSLYSASNPSTFFTTAEEDQTDLVLRYWHNIISSVRSSYSHPGLLVITTTTPLFQITPVLNTGLSLSEPLQLYKGYNAI